MEPREVLQKGKCAVGHTGPLPVSSVRRPAALFSTAVGKEQRIAADRFKEARCVMDRKAGSWGDGSLFGIDAETNPPPREK